jgi:hypothetical protein
VTATAAAGTARSVEATGAPPWLFSARIDLLVFLLPALVALALAPLGTRLSETPDWAWVPAVLLVDVAHVWSTGFRVYLDPLERARRPWLYTLIPLVGYGLGVVVYSQGAAHFWRALAYLAVFHFVRQQWGWVALYRARAGEHGRLGRLVDGAAIYLATLWPLVFWHAHLPRRFVWFLGGDFAALPALLARLLFPLYVAALVAYAVRAAWRARRGQRNPGKDVVVATTAACWLTGTVLTNSDFAFTVTNVLIHGVPYFALVYWYGRARRRQGAGGPFRLFAHGPAAFLAVLWLCAYLEELLWDRGIWHDRPWLFGAGWELGRWDTLLVPLLALPQFTHYVLDGLVWRRRDAGFTLLSARQGKAAPAGP